MKIQPIHSTVPLGHLTNATGEHPFASVARALRNLSLLTALAGGAAVQAQTVVSFTVVNADTGADIVTFTGSGTLTDRPANINIRANVSNATKVVFKDGTTTRTESTAPYSYKGDNNGVYNKWAPANGAYVITATPSNATATGPVATLTLTLNSSTPNPGVSTGMLKIDPSTGRHFVYDRSGVLAPAFLAGAGGPEGFLYMSDTRRTAIINKLLDTSRVASSVNGIYFHSTRAFGGDGAATETPFVNNDKTAAIDLTKLAAWKTDLKKLDDAGVTLWFTLFDDHSVPYGCQYNTSYGNYATTIVNYFKDLKNLIWVTQEEYGWKDGSQAACTDADNDNRQKGLAGAIRAADPVHPIGTHHRAGSNFNFPGDPNIQVYGQQTANSVLSNMHDTVGKQGWSGNTSATSKWVYVMAEAADYHKNLIANNDRATLRRSHWATAMSGGYVMMYDSFESHDPTDDMLDDLRRLKLFMESTPFNTMTPLFDTTLTARKLANTLYLLVNDAQGQYIVYGDFAAGNMGVNGAPAGTYALTWFDPASGQTVNQTFTVGTNGLASFTKPAAFGTEVALYLRKQ